MTELVKQVVNDINNERNFNFILTADNHKQIRTPSGVSYDFCPLTWYCHRHCNIHLPLYYGVQALILIMYSRLISKNVTFDDVIEAALQIVEASDNRGGHDPKIRAALLKEKA